MKYFITLSLVGLLGLAAGSSFAQQPTQAKKSLVLDGAFQRQLVSEKEPMPYPNVNESNVIWSKKIWRVIDLREKINFPLYYPTDDMQSRKSFVQAMVEAAQSGKITVYDTDTEEFTTVLSPQMLASRFNAGDRSVTRRKMDGSGDTTITIRGSINWGEVQELLVKEEWFFDKHYSQMFVRIIGICPIRVYNKELRVADEESSEGGERVKQQLFWIYYPDARKVLANTMCFTGENETSQTSYDDLFLKRRFNSYIIAESDNQNNRKLSSYTRNDFEMMLKSEEIKKKLFDFEQDLWEY